MKFKLQKPDFSSVGRSVGRSVMVLLICLFIPFFIAIGRVCVPISMKDVDTFDPFTVPTIRYDFKYFPLIKAFGLPCLSLY